MDKQQIIELVEMYDKLVWNYEFQPDNHSKKALTEFLKQWPNIRSYDTDGNFIPNVSQRRD